MGKTRLGFDIGSGSMKIAVFQGKKARFEEVRLPENMVDSAGSVAQPHSFVELLRQTKKELRLPKGDASLVLSSGEAVCRLVTMPRMTEEQLKLNLPYEFADVIQDTAKEYYCDYVVCERAEGDGEDAVPMMAAAASKTVLAGYAGMFARAGVKLKTIIPQAMAMIQLCMARGAGREEFCFVDLGHQSTRIWVVRGDRLQATRQIALGGQNVDALIADEVGGDLYLANTYKTSNFQNVLDLPGVSEFCDRVAVEILKVINFYQFTYRSNKLDGIYLTGGGAALGPLRRSIAGTMELPLLDPADLLPEAGERAAAGLFAAGAVMGGK